MKRAGPHTQGAWGAPIWPLVTLACLCGWLVTPAVPNREFDSDL